MAIRFLDAGQLLSAASDGEVRLWNTRDGSLRGVLRTRDPSLSDFGVALDLRPDGRALAHFVPYQRTLRLLGMEDSTLASLEVETSVAKTCFAPSGEYLALGCRDGTARLWDLRVESSPRVLGGHEESGSVLALAFSADGRLLASSGGDGTVRLWDPVAGCQAALGGAPVESEPSRVDYERVAHQPVFEREETLWYSATSKKSVLRCRICQLAYLYDWHEGHDWGDDWDREWESECLVPITEDEIEALRCDVNYALSPRRSLGNSR